MPTNPLDELVARVVAVRPEAAVPGLIFERFFWTHPDAQAAIRDGLAEAVIIRHWLSLLPDGWMLIKSSGRWAVVKDQTHAALWYGTPLEAIAAFLSSREETRR